MVTAGAVDFYGKLYFCRNCHQVHKIFIKN